MGGSEMTSEFFLCCCVDVYRERSLSITFVFAVALVSVPISLRCLEFCFPLFLFSE
jgi:hypothetical protein